MRTPHHRAELTTIAFPANRKPESGGLFEIGTGVLCLFLFLIPANGFAQENGFSLGYGFGILNTNSTVGEIENHRPYQFVQGTLFREFSIARTFFIVAEPYLAYTWRPREGTDAGVGLFFRNKLGNFFVSWGGGGAYSSIKFEEQGTHYFFILQGGIGYNWKNFFIENRFRHYSNGGLATPNHSINANIVSVGVRF
ncbi:MAG TPA: acyloxyacyl hydrolase [Thermodesulfobacteriota bacterium]|nr:acyloxyacyl hydrolase [Thermodesulfobacteriota bacterium]